MKKLWVLLVVLAVFAVTSPVYAGDNVTVGGEFKYYVDMEGNYGFPRVELNISSAVGDYNTLALELDSEGGDFPTAVALDDIRLKTDVMGALGLMLPVSVNYTIGYFDSYFTGWKYVSRSGYEFYYGPSSWGIFGNAASPNTMGAHQLDIGVGPANIHYWNDFNFDALKVGADAAFGPVSVYASFGGPVADLGTGVFNFMADFSTSFGDISLYVPAFIGMNLGTDVFAYGGGLSVDYTTLVHFAAGLYGETGSALDKLVIDLYSAPVDGLSVGLSAYMDPAATDVFTGLDIEAGYMIGAANFVLGYAYVTADGGTISAFFDDAQVNGLYFGVDIDY